MKRRDFLSLATAATTGRATAGTADEAAKLQFFLNPSSPSESYGLVSGEKAVRFPVGLGRDGVTEAGESFRGGSSLLGGFRISAVLSSDRFDMEEALIRESGRSGKWLRENLFRNMSSIDFDGDGRGNEYGEAFIGLAPVDSTAPQPFHFGEYRGTFRWYSYAIHGTQDESRIGKCITGGCLNVGAEALKGLLPVVEVGDRVTVRRG